MKVVFWGVGFTAKNFIDNLDNYRNVEIEYFLDNKAKENSYYGKYKCFYPTKEKCKDKKIIVTTRKEFYTEIKEQLEGFDLKENIDFYSLDKFLLELNNIKNMDKPLKRIWFEDFWPGFNIYNNNFIQILQRYYRIELDSEAPEYIFSSVFGNRALLYEGIRIIFTGENCIPDFNVYDYVIGFEYIEYEDRYLRWPLYKLYDSYEEAKKKHFQYNLEDFMKREFCCRVVSNGKRADIFREEIFEKINKIKPVMSGGKCKNNLKVGQPVKNKKEFLQKYKFNLAIENSFSHTGYTTEKIVDAWAAGCIPIYWGNKKIAEEFNEKAFVNCHNFKSIEEIVEYVIELNNDPQKLNEMLEEPIIKGNDELVIDKFLNNILNGEVEDSYRRISKFSACGKDIENVLKQVKLPFYNSTSEKQ